MAGSRGSRGGFSPRAFAEDFDDFFDKAITGFALCSVDGSIFRANRQFADWLGIERTTFEGQRISDFLTISGRVYYETHLAPLLRMQGYFDEVALELMRPDGKRVSVFINGYERRDENAAPLFVRFTIMRASQRRQYERNILAAHAAADNDLAIEKANSTLREQFIAVLGHDLRNPLAAIRSGLQLLARTPLSAQAQDVCDMMGKSATRMAVLIENIMDFARTRLSSGISLSREICDVQPALTHVVQELRISWPQRTIALEFCVTGRVNCDLPRLSQLLSNLLANALTHGAKDGGVVVRIETLETEFHLSVCNPGPAIAPEVLAKIFQPFTREDHRPSQQGLGLGLYIAAEIARAHGGHLTATSTDNLTCFAFSMPV